MIKEDSFILIWMENISIQNKIPGKGMAVSNLNLQINAGEFVCISGLHGRDKISFINTLSCLEKPNAGKYLYDYNDTTVIEQRELNRLRSQIGFLFKGINIIERLTVYQNIEIPVGISKSLEKSKTIIKAAEALGIADLLQIQVSKLTDMEKHKVALARAMAVNPMLIIADEPADGLKLEDAELILEHLGRINKQGAAIICFSEKKQVVQSAKRHIVFEKGSISSDSEPLMDCVEEVVV